jgi:tRNA G26 N,N-dimethylase Trm1
MLTSIKKQHEYLAQIDAAHRFACPACHSETTKAQSQESCAHCGAGLRHSVQLFGGMFITTLADNEVMT